MNKAQALLKRYDDLLTRHENTRMTYRQKFQELCDYWSSVNDYYRVYLISALLSGYHTFVDGYFERLADTHDIEDEYPWMGDFVKFCNMHFNPFQLAESMLNDKILDQSRDSIYCGPESSIGHALLKNKIDRYYAGDRHAFN